MNYSRPVGRTRFVRQSALAVALVAALLGMPRDASALVMQPGDVAKLSYDFSSVLPAGETAQKLDLGLLFGNDGPFVGSLKFQFFNSDGTAITSQQTFTDPSSPASSVSGFGFNNTFSGPISSSGFALLTSVDANFDLATANLQAFVPPFTFLSPVNVDITSVSATPLPPTWGMMLTGLGLVAYLAFRRKESGVLAAA